VRLELSAEVDPLLTHNEPRRAIRWSLARPATCS